MLLPCRCYEHECWRDRCFCHAQKESHGDQTAIAVTDGCESDNKAPDKSVCCEIFSHGDAGNKVCCWIFPEEVAKVKDAGDPRVLLAFQALSICVVRHTEGSILRVPYSILSQPEDGCRRQDCLVHEVQIIRYEHERYQSPIDLA